MKFKSFKIVEICLMIKTKFLSRKFLVLNFILQPYFSPLDTFIRKGKDLEQDTGGPKTYGSHGSGSGSGTLAWTLLFLFFSLPFYAYVIDTGIFLGY